MRPLRKGFTTGLCAAAAAKGAAIALLSGEPVELVEVCAKGGQAVRLNIKETILEGNSARCGVLKDAGDDPDITNGITVFASVSKAEGHEIAVEGGAGVGVVTKPGLKVPVGQAAINPAPMEMIRQAIAEACGGFGYKGGIKAVISVPQGEQIAKKTMNERLGILGGVSILGTTGIVEPMSVSAVLETIKAEIDVLAATGGKYAVVTPGNYGRDFAKNRLGINIEEAVKCSNFIGETLDYLVEKQFEGVTLIGHAGKLVKLAAGVMNTHSKIADCRMEVISAHCAMAGASPGAIRRLMECVTVEGAIGVMEPLGISEAVWESIGRKIGEHISGRTEGAVMVEYIVFTQEHGVLIRGRA